jgi:hypothetical protein
MTKLVGVYVLAVTGQMGDVFDATPALKCSEGSRACARLASDVAGV